LLESDAWRLCVDLGLATGEGGNPGISNPMYREVIARETTYGTQYMISQPEWQREKPDGSLDMDTLLKEFQVFRRRNSELWEAKSDYTEPFPHLFENMGGGVPSYLVIFDRRTEKPAWDARLKWSVDGGITVVECR
jgi:hypothetical protein